jgi:DNA-binding HxlR family transcriptional regulator
MTVEWSRSSAFVGLIGGRWTLKVLAELAAGGRRYQDLHDGLDGISHKVLTDTLRGAERDGLIRRHLDPGRTGTANLYELTDLGRSLDEPLAALGLWVDANWGPGRSGSAQLGRPSPELTGRRLTAGLLAGTSRCLSFR